MTSLRNLGHLRVNLGLSGSIRSLLGSPEESVRLQMPLRVSKNLDLSTSEPHLFFQISQLIHIAETIFCIQTLRMDLSFQEKKKQFKDPKFGCRDICKINTAPFFWKHPVGNDSYIN